MANRNKAKAIYDERFCRMWEFYLAGSEAAFRWQDLMVFQIQVAKKNDVVPLTRDYIAKTERSLAMHEMGHSGTPPVAGPGEPAPTRAPTRAIRRRRKVSGKATGPRVGWRSDYLCAMDPAVRRGAPGGEMARRAARSLRTCRSRPADRLSRHLSIEPLFMIVGSGRHRRHRRAASAGSSFRSAASA